LLYRTPKLGDECAISKCILASTTIEKSTDGSKEGIEDWLKLSGAHEIRTRIESGQRSLVADENGRIVGYIAFKRGNHLSLLFVERNSTRKGIATTLFVQCTKGFDQITVNSSDIAVPFYKKMGFLITGDRALKNGGWITPMLWKLTLNRALQRTAVLPVSDSDPGCGPTGSVAGGASAADSRKRRSLSRGLGAPAQPAPSPRAGPLSCTAPGAPSLSLRSADHRA